MDAYVASRDDKNSRFRESGGAANLFRFSKYTRPDGFSRLSRQDDHRQWKFRNAFNYVSRANMPYWINRSIHIVGRPGISCHMDAITNLREVVLSHFDM